MYMRARSSSVTGIERQKVVLLVYFMYRVLRIDKQTIVNVKILFTVGVSLLLVRSSTTLIALIEALTDDAATALGHHTAECIL